MKFADDSALLSLLFGSQQDHGPALRDFVKWCDDSYLKFNVCKTKELAIDFRKHSHSPEKTTIRDQEVEVVTKYKYIGTVFDNKLRWDDNTEVIVKKCHSLLIKQFKPVLQVLLRVFFALPLSAGIST